MFKKNIPNTKYQIPNTFNKAGTALLMTILILNSIILVSLAAAKLVVSGVKMGDTQAKSTKAYFAAEAGAESFLYEYRKIHTNGCDYEAYSSCSFSKKLSNNSSYAVSYITGTDASFLSQGAYANLQRSVELDFNY